MNRVRHKIHRVREQPNRDGGRAQRPRRHVSAARDGRGGEGI